ncbi:MAG: rane protein of unknown function [Acidimicrobiaceae bacterium]|nr:rane protein of unknown function [Acidimicrobiaceae bacterium]
MLSPEPATGADAILAPPRRCGRWIRWAVSVLSVVVLATFIATRRAALATSFERLGHPGWSWIPVAIALELASMVTFARMQRRLLSAGGSRIGNRPMVATTLAANALSVSVPVAGPELGTAFSFRRFKRQGADTSLAGWSLLVGGFVSSVGVILILAVGGALLGNALVTGVAVLAGLTGVAAVITLRAVVNRPQLRTRLERPAAWIIGRAADLVSHPIDDPHEAIRRWLHRLDSLRLSKSEWLKVGTLGLTNWLADAGVLAVSVLAVGAPVPWRAVLLVYGVANVVGSVGITPGGIGFVEGTLCLGLVRAGVPVGQALAAVLLYRLTSFWLVTAVGWLVLLYLRLERPARAASIQGAIAS